MTCRFTVGATRERNKENYILFGGTPLHNIFSVYAAGRDTTLGIRGGGITARVVTRQGHRDAA